MLRGPTFGAEDGTFVSNILENATAPTPVAFGQLADVAHSDNPLESIVYKGPFKHYVIKVLTLYYPRITKITWIADSRRFFF